MLAGVQPAVSRMLQRGQVNNLIGDEHIFWSADQAIVAAEKYDCGYCGPG